MSRTKMFNQLGEAIGDFFYEFKYFFEFLVVVIGIAIGSWLLVTLLPVGKETPALPPEPAVVRSQDDTGMFVVYINVNGTQVPCIVYPASEKMPGWGDCLPELVK